MIRGTFDDKSGVVQVMAWCRLATNHYLSQCWRRLMLPRIVTGPQWVKQYIGQWDKLRSFVGVFHWGLIKMTVILQTTFSNASTGSGNRHQAIHYKDVIMRAMASQITGVSIVCSIVCSGADQRKHQSPTSLAFVRGIHRQPVDPPHKGPVKRKCFHLMTSSWSHEAMIIHFIDACLLSGLSELNIEIWYHFSGRTLKRID